MSRHPPVDLLELIYGTRREALPARSFSEGVLAALSSSTSRHLD